MPSPSDSVLTLQMRADLADLANGALPLQRWIEQKPYDPSKDPTFAGEPMPWREPGRTLTPAMTGFEVFFAGLLRETSDDTQALDRWRRVAADPLARSPLPDMATWRGERGLDAEASFGVVSAQDVLLDSQGDQIARIPFYQAGLADLAYCLRIARPASPAEWEALALALFEDQVAAWPGTVWPASVFMNQFVADVLYAVLGMRNFSAVDGQPEYATAVLTELGQARRRGNKNTPAEAAVAVKRFLAEIAKGNQAPTPAAGASRP